MWSLRMFSSRSWIQRGCLVEQLMNVLDGRYFRPRRKLITGQGYFSLISVDNGRVIMKEH